MWRLMYQVSEFTFYVYLKKYKIMLAKPYAKSYGLPHDSTGIICHYGQQHSGIQNGGNKTRVNKFNFSIAAE